MIANEPLPGSAKEAAVTVMFEWPGGWSRDVLDGGTFGPELSVQLKTKFKGMGFQLIRRPGRDGRQIGAVHRCFIAWSQEQKVEMLLLDGPERLLELDMSGPGRNGGGEIDTPLVLVCTHGKRDVCCAVKGRPLAAELAEFCAGGMVWESSHTKGHRFAPAVLLFPWNYSFGRLNVPAAREMVAAAAEGRYFYPANRGNGLLTPPAQVAELAVARQLIDAGEALHYGELVVEEAASAPAAIVPSAGPVFSVRHRDGRAWDVRLGRMTVSGVVSSCGDAPKDAQVWVAEDVTSA